MSAGVIELAEAVLAPVARTPSGRPGGRRVQRLGRVSELLGLNLQVVGVRAAVGDLLEVLGPTPLLAEVVASSHDHLVCLPLGRTDGVHVGAPVRSTGGPLSIKVGDALRGRVLDGLGRPADGGPALDTLPASRTPSSRTRRPTPSPRPASSSSSASASAPWTRWCRAAPVSASASWPAPGSASPACSRWSPAAPRPRSRSSPWSASAGARSASSSRTTSVPRAGPLGRRRRDLRRPARRAAARRVRRHPDRRVVP